MKVSLWLQSSFSSIHADEHGNPDLAPPETVQVKPGHRADICKQIAEHDNESSADCKMSCFSRKAVRDSRKKPTSTVSKPVEPSKDKKKKQGVRDTSESRRQLRDDDSDGESIITCTSTVTSKLSRKSSNRPSRRLRSGVLDRPRSNVMMKVRWPHMNQDPRYVRSSLMYDQLNFCQFVGGETRTILRTGDPIERQGRLKILAKIAYLHDQCNNWRQARETYYAIMCSIEEGDADWTSPLGLYDLMCPPVYGSRGDNKVDRMDKVDRNPMVTKVRVGPVKKDFFCRDYQKGECNTQAPHKSWIRNNFESVDHFCATCFKAKLGKLTHVPGTESCSQGR